MGYISRDSHSMKLELEKNRRCENMAYRRRFGRRTKSRWGRIAHAKARKAYRRVIKLPKRIVAKKYANTVGQIVFKSHKTRPSHGRKRRFGRRFKRGLFR